MNTCEKQLVEQGVMGGLAERLLFCCVVHGVLVEVKDPIPSRRESYIQQFEDAWKIHTNAQKLKPNPDYRLVKDGEWCDTQLREDGIFDGYWDAAKQEIIYKQRPNDIGPID